MTQTPVASRTKAVIYCRLSSDPTGRAATVQRQEADCRALAEQLGWDVIDVHVDNDLSAYSGKPRPGYRKLLHDIRTGRAEAIVAWHTDRLYRRLPDLEELVQAVQENHVQIRTCKAGIIDLSTASGVMTAEIQASVAKHEVAHLIERVKAAKNAATAKGEYRGGPRPFGYESDGTTIREDEAKWVRYATRAIIDGESLRSICRTLAEHNVRTVPRRKRLEDGTRTEPEAREWRPAELRKLLLRARNAGMIEVSPEGEKGVKRPAEIVGKAVWPALVDEETWRACKGVLENPARRTTTGNGRVWLLSGIARCWCGSTMRGSTTGIGGKDKAGEDGKSHRPAYRCNANASHAVRDAKSLDAFIENQAVARLARPDAAELHLKVVKTEPSEDLPAQAANLRVKLDSIAADYAQDLITRQQMLDMNAITRDRLNAVMAKMAGRASTSVLAALPLGTPEIKDAWKDYHLDRRRQVIDALMSITVNKARRGRPPGYKPPANGEKGSYFDPTTIAIGWKPPA